jgi:hypothetical protein
VGRVIWLGGPSLGPSCGLTPFKQRHLLPVYVNQMILAEKRLYQQGVGMAAGDIFPGCFRDMHSRSGECVNVHVTEGRLLLRRQNGRIGRCIVLYNVELNF